MSAKSNVVLRIKLLVLFVFVCLFVVAFWMGETLAKQGNTPADKPPAEASVRPQPTPTPPPAAVAAPSAPQANAEGCLTCHNNIEPMHKYAGAKTLENLDDGKDAVGLSCTACHGGNPAATTQKDAHVQPRFPKEWGCKNGE